MPSSSRSSDEALSILLDPSKRSEAEGIFRRLLTAIQEKHGTDSPEAAAISNKLGEIIVFDGRHAEAVELFWQAIGLSAAQHQVSQQVATYYRNLGLSLACLGRRDDGWKGGWSLFGVIPSSIFISFKLSSRVYLRPESFVVNLL